MIWLAQEMNMMLLKAEYEAAENQLNELNLTIEQTNQVSSALELDNQKFRVRLICLRNRLRHLTLTKQLHSKEN